MNYRSKKRNTHIFLVHIQLLTLQIQETPKHNKISAAILGLILKPMLSNLMICKFWALQWVSYSKKPCHHHLKPTNKGDIRQHRFGCHLGTHALQTYIEMYGHLTKPFPDISLFKATLSVRISLWQQTDPY